MFVLSFYSVTSYSVVKNTTSHLGAQSAPNAWIMNGAFIFVGISCKLESIIHLHRYVIPKILLIIFGISLTCIGIFQYAPIAKNVAYNGLEDKLHFIFANLVGISFSALAISIVFLKEKYQSYYRFSYSDNHHPFIVIDSKFSLNTQVYGSG